MKKVAKLYFTHPSVWTYIGIGTIVAILAYRNGFFHNYWYVGLLPVLIAPFFEWFAHKYLLHAQVGNVKEIPIRKDAKKGDWIEEEFFGKPKKVQILNIANGKMLVGYGWARNWKGMRDFMHALHYGHHEDPNNIPLIFAPIMSVIVLFASLFGITFLLTLNLGIATMFVLGVIIYYLHYEWMHLGHHVPNYKHIFPWSNRLKTAHQLHHYRNENYWWGITNNIGDKILGTYKKYDEVPMSDTTNKINQA